MLLLVFGLAVLPGAGCDHAGAGPVATLSLNAIEDDLDDLLVVPRHGFVIHVAFQPGAAAIDPSSFGLRAFPWSGAPARVLTSAVPVDASGGVGVLGSSHALPSGSYTLFAEIQDVEGHFGGASFDFAVREFPSGSPPIGTGQKIWYDFEVDRDGDLAPDFPEDLASFGLASPAAPGIAADVEARVIGLVLDRIESIYHDEDPNGLGDDPVAVDFFAADPGGSEVTRICVGGQAPSTPLLIGSIYVDLDNASREGTWCDSLPPTGLFPRGIHAWAGNGDYQATFAPTMPSLGGTPLGEHPLDPIVFDPAFDPGAASAAELARWNDAETAIVNFANVLAGVTAHETGHALGLVAPGMPGVGLHGGLSGAAYAHDVEADGSVPPENYLMKAGPSSSFSSMGGLSGFALPFLRPFDHAWLRDRLVRDPAVTELLPPPTITGVSPTLITSDTFVTITGEGFAPGGTVRLLNDQAQFPLLFLQYQPDGTQVRGLASHSQIVPGTYFLVGENPDGQLVAAFTPIVVE